MRALLLIIIWPGLALAHDWERLDGLAIADLLIGHGIVVGSEVQRYHKGGIVQQGATTGRWRLERYGLCHDLNGGWACFEVQSMHGELVRLIDQQSHVTEATIVP